MADKKITDMTALAAGSQASGDLVTVVDISEGAAANKNKKMTMENLFKGIPGNVGVGVNPTGWHAAASSKVIQLANSVFFDFSGVQLDVGKNYYYDGSNYKRIAADGAQRIAFFDENFIFNQAASGSAGSNISWSEAMRVHSSGKLLVGTSSTATAGTAQYSLLQVEGNAFNAANNAIFSLARGTAATSMSSGDVLGTITFADNAGNEFGKIECSADATPGSSDYPGRLTFSTTADAASSPTERMRIDSSGRLLIGRSTAPTGSSGSLAKLVVEGYIGGSTGTGIISLQRGEASTSVVSGDELGRITFADNTGDHYAFIRGVADGTASNDSNDNPGKIEFWTSTDGTDAIQNRMQITRNGTVQMTPIGSVDVLQCMTPSSAGTSVLVFAGGHSATTGTPGSGTQSVYIFSNGNIQNTNNSYGQISDIKLKENIIDANSQWDDFKAVRFRKYNFKEETGHETHTQLGVVAQELEVTSPGLVYETEDKDSEGNALGTTTKAVRTSVLTMKALVALQEAMQRIETLEAKVAALEAG